ncbi:HNH endonuclease [Tardiphaga sp. 804_B3_N1_9]|uniref:HNH endonuclease n=1 Tax=Tardiphaga sp. 804_B3_N1_9 TaxID=3240786 RepID=UPI003F1EE0DC
MRSRDLDPVHRSKNNHPENLLWLCKNHHKAYDNGLYGPIDEDVAFVEGFKRSLHRHRLFLWQMQHQISNKLITVLEDCNALAAQLAAATTAQQIKAVKKIAKSTLENLPKLAPVSKTDPNYQAVQTISANVASLSKDKGAIAARLKKAGAIREEYAAAFGFVACPLCKGSGTHESTDCPVCGGDREIEEQLAERVDLQAYKKVNCPVCDGDGIFRGDLCPGCGGEARMDRRYAEAIEVDDYTKVDCPRLRGLREVRRQFLLGMRR